MRYPAPLSFGNWLMCRADFDDYYDLAGAYACCLIHGCYLGVPDGLGQHGQRACFNEAITGPGAHEGIPRLYADRWGPLDLRQHMVGLDTDGPIEDACWAAYLRAEDFFTENVLTDWSGWCGFLRAHGVMAPILGEMVSVSD